MPRRRSGKKIDFVHWTGFSGQIANLGATAVGSVVLSTTEHATETLLRT